LAFHVQNRRRNQVVVLVADAGVDDEEAQNIPADVVQFFPPITEQSPAWHIGHTSYNDIWTMMGL